MSVSAARAGSTTAATTSIGTTSGGTATAVGGASATDPNTTADADPATAVGKTTLSVHSALFENYTGVGLAFSHRFNTDVLLAIDGGFAHAASENVGRIGISVEF